MKHKILFFLCGYFSLCAQTFIGVQTLHTYDESRQRPVGIEIWYPIEQKEYQLAEATEWNAVWQTLPEARDVEVLPSLSLYPIIIMSHGNWGDRRDRSWFAEQMVLYGYIVMSVEHYGNTWQYMDPAFFFAPWNRPLDISFALDQILEHPIFSRVIDSQRIGFCGYSLGSMTGVWLAGGRLKNLSHTPGGFNAFGLSQIFQKKILENFDIETSIQSFHDSRIKAYFLMAPFVWGFNEHTFSEITAPMHIVASKGDTIAPYALHSIYLEEYVPNIELSMLDTKANHYVFLNIPSDWGRQCLPIWFYEEHPSVQREEIHESITEKALLFFSGL